MLLWSSVSHYRNYLSLYTTLHGLWQQLIRVVTKLPWLQCMGYYYNTYIHYNIITVHFHSKVQKCLLNRENSHSICSKEQKAKLLYNIGALACTLALASKSRVFRMCQAGHRHTIWEDYSSSFCFYSYFKWNHKQPSTISVAVWSTNFPAVIITLCSESQNPQRCIKWLY